MTKLKVNRVSEWLNWASNYRLFLNGKEIGIIENGEEKNIEIQKGNHILEVKNRWHKSQFIEFSIDNEIEKKVKISGCNYNKFLIVGFFLMTMFFSIRVFFEIDIKFILGITVIIFLFPLYALTFGKQRVINLSEI